MKTVVYQSYRTQRVPGWIATCMSTVKAWAQASGFDYRFFDDSFLALPPAWYVEKCAGEICPVTDLARLMAARELLASGYERTVWVDADMLVFAPDALTVDGVEGFAFSLELWAWLDAQGQLQCDQRVNNSLFVMTRDNRQLDFLIDACLRIAMSKPRLDKLDIGSRFMTKLAESMPMPLVANVGLFSPLLMQAIANGDEAILRAYAQKLPIPLACANLCGSLVGQEMQGFAASSDNYDAVVRACLGTRGEVVNRLMTAR